MDTNLNKATSDKPIIKHINDFLDYCDVEKGLRSNTQKNYQEYLNKFFGWLKSRNLEALLPHQLTPEHIWEYRLYLSRRQDPKTRKTLQKSTQNYYLIALRAFLGYFVAKDILSLPPGKIALPKANNALNAPKTLSKGQVNAILNAPRGNSPIAIRDRAILYTIISTGLKVKQLTELDRDSVNDLPGNILPHLNDYIKTRNDGEKALFINYRSKKNASRRLTVRFVEKIVRKYGDLIDDSIHITPETLRSANILTSWDKTIEIKSLPWQKVEYDIKREIFLLKESISTMPEKYKSQSPLSNLIKCDDCIFRKIAILIISGLVKVEKLTIKSFWSGFCFDESTEGNIRHGADWHRKMINSVAQYFEKLDDKNKIIIEPILSYGRADIGIIKNNEKHIYIEVGTVSLFKIWYNLMEMPNSIFILVPNNDLIIKFEN